MYFTLNKEEVRGKKFNVTFKNPTCIILNGRYEFVKSAVLKFFEIDGFWYYVSGRLRRRGYPVSFQNSEIESMVEVEKKVRDIKKDAKTILNKIHPNAWDNIRKQMNELINDGDKGEYIEDFIKNPKFRSVKSVIPKWEQEYVMKNLRSAFENKTDFSWGRKSYSSRGRDFSIQCKKDNDGMFRAWFSSEFSGCGNGDYYLLLNPTTAVYYERD